jgi:sugar lactone lactonase YvrE
MSVLIDYSSGAFAANKAQGVGTVTAGAGDVDFADVSLLLHGDGTSGSTTITDSSSSPKTVTVNGNAQIDTAVKKFGTGSIEFDGTNDYLTTPYVTTDYDWWTSDFTLEAWVYPTTFTGWYEFYSGLGDIGTLIGNMDPTGSGAHWTFGITSSGAIRLYYYNGGSVNTPASTETVSLNQWNHIAVVKDSNGYKYFVNGIGGSYNSISGTPQSNASFGLSIGQLTGTSINGYVDDLRITKGTARYTSNFTPPTAAFPDGTSGPINLDISSGTYFNYTPSANTTFTFANAPASGTAAGFALAVTGANVGTGYDIANASYDNVDFLTKASGNGPNGIFFKPDGTKFYISDATSDVIRQYSLTTAWDITTATEGTTKSVSSQDTATAEVFFKSDGTKMFVLGFTNNKVFEYDLSTAWDSSTASYNSVSFDFSSQETSARGLCFDPTGTKMYLSGESTDAVNQYDLSSAWDVSSASFTQSFSVTSQDTNPSGIFFTPDGTRMIISGNGNDNIYQYSLTSGFDISTASYDSVSFSVSGQMSGCQGLFFKSDGTKMYVIGFNNRLLRQYSTGSSATATFSYPASVEWPSGTAPDGPAIGETDVLVFLTDDGGTSYQGFQAGDAMS